MLRRSLLVILAAVALARCSYVPSFVERGYDDFTAYYNTFHNAESAFEEGRRGLDERTQPIDRTVHISLFPTPEQVSNKGPFDEAIEKSASILREHPNSRWVDEALLLIGKSYFYLQNYVGAEQKFREVIALEGGQADEARFWLARTLTASGAYDEGIQHLEASLSRNDLSNDWAPRLHLALGQLYVRQGEWEQALPELETGLKGVGDRAVTARTHFLLGQVYERTEAYGKAIEHFRSAAARRPRYELGYAARLSAIRVQGLHGNAERALQNLQEMESDDKHYENRAELAYLRGRIYQAQGQHRRAEQQYREVLYRSEGNVRDVRPSVHYALGRLYRDEYANFVQAAAHFDTAATAVGQGGDQTYADASYRTSEALAGVQEEAEMFNTYAEAHSQVSRMDSLLHLGRMDEEAFRKAILRIRRQRAREMAKQRRAEQRRRQTEAFQQQGQGSQRRSSQNEAANAGGEAGFLFHKDPVQVQQSKSEFRQRWGDRPLVENWRRLEDVTAVADGESGAVGGITSDSLAAQGQEAALPTIDVSEVPRTAESQAQMERQRAQARYELGNVLFLQMNEPDSAASWYRKVITEDDNQPVAERAYYALAEVQRSLGDTASARQLYEEVLRRTSDEELEEHVQSRLGRTVQRTTSPDSLSLARSAYEAAQAHWEASRYREALQALLRVARKYPSTPIAPKALLAAGSVSLEWARHDSLDLQKSLPLELSDSLRAHLGLTSPADTSRRDSVRTAARSDSVQVDSLRADSLRAGRPDSVRADSLRPSEGLAPPDTNRREGISVAALYEALTTHYPESPQAEQAHRVLQALQERASTAAADSSSGEKEAPAEQQEPPPERPPSNERQAAPPDSVEQLPDERLLQQEQRQQEETPARERQALPDSTRRQEQQALPDSVRKQKGPTSSTDSVRVRRERHAPPDSARIE